MYLKGIKMQGFKSFADKIELEFGHGITAIVGPNGSGKSNVSDAIRWVMGEQSAKTLRGSKMEDVIFAGTQSRKPMGFAEVSIILDNSDKSLGIDFDEVTVTRRVHRSGESEYMINKSPCRLRDIYELFMDTGIGKEGYSVIGQGKIDQILSSKSEDRRHIFEEAAGISKYKFRKNEAEKELFKTEENLVRIRDILSELKAQVGPLEIQSKKARKYLDIREVLKGLEVNIAILNIDKFRKITKESEEALKISLSQLNDSKEELEKTEAELENLRKHSDDINSEIGNIKDERFSLEKSEGSILSKIELCKNNIENNLKNIERLKSESEELSAKYDENEKNGAEYAKKLSETDEKVKAVLAEIENLDAKIKGLAKDTDKVYDDIEDAKAEIVEKLNKIASDKASLNSLDTVSDNFSGRNQSITDEIENKKQILLQNEEELKSVNEALSKNSDEKKDALKNLEKLKEKYFAITKENDTLKKEQNERTALYNRKYSRKKALEDLERSLEGYSRSVKMILSNSNLEGICGVVSKLLEVDAKYVTAIETAMGRAMQNIVVTNEKAAKNSIEYLKNSNGGRATFMPLTSVSSSALISPPSNDKGYIGIASSLIEYDKKYDGIFKYLLGKTVICDNLDNATAIAKKHGYKFRIVTLDGQVVNAGGSFTGGSADKHSGLISRTKEIEALRDEVLKLQKLIDKSDLQIEKNLDAIRKIASEKEKLDSAVANCSHEEVKLNSQKSFILQKDEEAKKAIDMLSDEIGSIGKEIDAIKVKRKLYTSQISDAEADVLKIRENLSNLQKIYDEKTIENKNYENDLTQKKIEHNDILKDSELINARIENAFLQKNELANSIESKKNEINDYISENQKLETEITDYRQSMTNSKATFDELDKKHNELSQKYGQTLNKIKELQSKTKAKQDVVFVLGQEVTRCENKAAKAESDTEAVINKLWEDYELTYSDACEMKKDIGNLNDAVREANSLKRQIKELGNINVDAIEEYKAVKERFEFLQTQESDLNKAKSNLNDIITKMQSIMTEKFTQSFEFIKVEFNNVFRELFGGGAAKLYFADESDILESGIEIEVQPPGKKLQNLTLLSGGERAFAAIALLFAVLKTSPTPFCLLDEVEAALDEVNVYKFADYAKKYSENTQFLIVTHRRGTMEAADIMYGVTMQEKGVSKLLKLNFDDLEEYDV